jgi:hypothetical protein
MRGRINLNVARRGSELIENPADDSAIDKVIDASVSVLLEDRRLQVVGSDSSAQLGVAFRVHFW